MRVAYNVAIVPDAYLDEEEEWWPRNVRVAHESLPGSVMENILAGIPYDDDRDREDFATVWLWFPAVCSEKPEDGDLTLMDACRWEFIAVVLMALAGEGSEWDF